MINSVMVRVYEEKFFLFKLGKIRGGILGQIFYLGGAMPSLPPLVYVLANFRATATAWQLGQ